MLKWVIGNWKMNGSLKEAHDFAEGAVKKLPHVSSHVMLGIAPPFLYLSGMLGILRDTAMMVGAQTCSDRGQYGPYTGDVSASMIKDVGANFVIIGHSERRSHGETSTSIASQIACALEAGLSVVLCVGETMEERDSGLAKAVVLKQLESSLPKHAPAKTEQFFAIAYEPVWAIGTGRLPMPEELSEMTHFCRQIMKDRWQIDIPVLYGGSVKPSNVHDVLIASKASGVLVGGASLSPEDFFQLVANLP